jgi:hypothetical protein
LDGVRFEKNLTGLSREGYNESSIGVIFPKKSKGTIEKGKAIQANSSRLSGLEQAFNALLFDLGQARLSFLYFRPQRGSAPYTSDTVVRARLATGLPFYTTVNAARAAS